MTKSLHCCGFVGVYVNIILILALQFFCCLLKLTQEVSNVFFRVLNKKKEEDVHCLCQHRDRAASF